MGIRNKILIDGVYKKGMDEERKGQKGQKGRKEGKMERPYTYEPIQLVIRTSAGRCLQLPHRQ